jgi:hypothetical protein
MNIRQQLYKKNRLAGMNEYNSARAAGYSEAYSRNARPEKVVKGCLADAFEQAGLTDKALIAHANAGMNANKVISCNVIAPNGEAMSDAHGTTKDFIDVPDWGNRHKYFETVLKLTDRMKEKAAIEINTYTQIWNAALDKMKVIDERGRISRAKV